MFYSRTYYAIISGDLDCNIESKTDNQTLPHPVITLGGNLSHHSELTQVVPLEDAGDHQYPEHVHLEDNSLVYALVNKTAGFTW